MAPGGRLPVALVGSYGLVRSIFTSFGGMYIPFTFPDVLTVASLSSLAVTSWVIVPSTFRPPILVVILYEEKSPTLAFLYGFSSSAAKAVGAAARARAAANSRRFISSPS